MRRPTMPVDPASSRSKSCRAIAVPPSAIPRRISPSSGSASPHIFMRSFDRRFKS